MILSTRHHSNTI